MNLEDQGKRYEQLASLMAKKVSKQELYGLVGATSEEAYMSKVYEYLGELPHIPEQAILTRLKNTHTKNRKEESKEKKVINKPVKLEEMQELVTELGKAAKLYYNGKESNMSDFEYDKQYDKLLKLEEETGTILAGSVTQKIGYEVVSKLPKIKHTSKMLSLDKTKDRNDLAMSLGGQPGLLSWKLDGLTVVMTYEGGKLVSVVTRGNGQIGEDITHNARYFKGVPQVIKIKERLVVRGEGLISYDTFNKINAKITKEEDKYKNARNLASGSVRQLDSKIAASRRVDVVAFGVVEGIDNLHKYSEKLEYLKELGFDVVEYKHVTPDTTVKAIEYFEGKIESNKYPTDGLVILIDDIAYGEMLGETSKFPKNSKAFKWKDEVVETTLLSIDWSASRTGAINPVAVFKAVDIDGTTVSRASVHNVSIVKSLKLGIGDTITVYKANMIIPQIGENLTQKGGVEIPEQCPVCGGKTTIVQPQQTLVLMCTNKECAAKHIGSLTHFVSRDAMNIDGLSEATLEKLVNEGMIKKFLDIYYIFNYEKEIVKMEGFGKGSYTKMIKAIEKSRVCDLPNFLYALGVEQLGRSTSKDICKALDYDLDKIVNSTLDELKQIDGVGDKTATEIVKYFEVNKDEVLNLAKEMQFNAVQKVDKNSPIAGKTFCITGDVYIYTNRKELQAKIESLGAKASSSVSTKTNYLINNDIASPSSKNQKAKELGVPIISENDFQAMIGE